jgi:putative membrane protein insertion efficiency factor
VIRRWVLGLVVLLGFLVVHDLAVAPERAFGARAAIAGIDVYQRVISPRIGPFVRCRFVPTCSTYMRESIRKKGLAVGVTRGTIRIAKCGPWTPQGTIDEP